MKEGLDVLTVDYKEKINVTSTRVVTSMHYSQLVLGWPSS